VFSEPSIESRGEVSWELARAAKLHRQRTDELLSTIGLHVGQDILLNVLWTEGEMTQTDLARQLEIRPATLTVALGRLEKAGFVTRTRDPEDKRVRRVRPSSRSSQLRDAVMLAWSRLEHDTVKNLTEPEQKMLAILLGKASDSLTDS
jgi:DNA-binding MarR family transcriptional regulator